jgi:hypothetical protein
VVVHRLWLLQTCACAVVATHATTKAPATARRPLTSGI